MEVDEVVTYCFVSPEAREVLTALLAYKYLLNDS